MRRQILPHLVHSISLPQDYHSAIAASYAGVPVIHDVRTMAEIKTYVSAPTTVTG